jgi:aspartate racemase
VAREVAASLANRGVHEVGLLATVGTYRAGLYDQALRAAGVQCHSPQPDEQGALMHGIYHGVKVGNMALAQASFTQVAGALARRHGLSTLVLGCTEIPLALESVPELDALTLVDPAVVLARALAQRAYGA